MQYYLRLPLREVKSMNLRELFESFHNVLWVREQEAKAAKKKEG